MTFLLVVALAAIAAVLGYVAGSRARSRSQPRPPLPPPIPGPPATAPLPPTDDFGAEKARLVRSRDRECARLAEKLIGAEARCDELAEFARERERLFAELADARAETARYRQTVIDIENNAPPPILAGVGEPDDLKLIVGVGPVLERMLHNLGITTFRQIARWSERDVAEFDARLPEFPGRIQRDQWVTQARALHESKYGQSVPGLRG
jgi:predicted flap endonuclease-1-like 5' DNA nuclease